MNFWATAAWVPVVTPLDRGVKLIPVGGKRRCEVITTSNVGSRETYVCVSLHTLALIKPCTGG